MPLGKEVAKEFTGKMVSSCSHDQIVWRGHSLLTYDPTRSQRKPQMCARCKQVKYPPGAPSSENHKREHCSDGVRSTLRKGSGHSDTLPPWPQPEGIFTRGAYFHPIVFLARLKALCENLHTNGTNHDTIDLESNALWSMFKARTTEDAGTGAILFQLFDHLTLSPPNSVDELVITYEGKSYLKIPCVPSTNDAAFAAVPEAEKSNAEAAGKDTSASNGIEAFQAALSCASGISAGPLAAASEADIGATEGNREGTQGNSVEAVN